MGGRLDAVNIVDPTVAVVVSIGLDHQEFLGSTPRGHRARKGGNIPARRARGARQPRHAGRARAHRARCSARRSSAWGASTSSPARGPLEISRSALGSIGSAAARAAAARRNSAMPPPPCARPRGRSQPRSTYPPTTFAQGLHASPSGGALSGRSRPARPDVDTGCRAQSRRGGVLGEQFAALPSRGTNACGMRHSRRQGCRRSRARCSPTARRLVARLDRRCTAVARARTSRSRTRPRSRSAPHACADDGPGLRCRARGRSRPAIAS